MKKVNLRQVKEDAQALFAGGGFLCSEAVAAVIQKHIAPQMPDSLIAAASGFPGGVGRSRCLCGAVSGGVLCLGYLFGRTAPSAPDDPKSLKTLDLADELQTAFRAQHKGVLCCHVHTKGFDMAAGEHKSQCAVFTGEMAAKTAEIAARELGLALEE
ncbi:C-GCAxxG-C-C family protein [Breznakiellaceae bacterium SP9]